MSDRVRHSLTERERRFLRLLDAAGATVSIGLSVGDKLKARGLVRVVKFGRLGITELGRAALALAPRAK